MQNFFIFITGPTCVGKTDFVFKLGEELSKKIDLAFINGDMGQMYEPISIGTAKPDWKSEKIPHYLFDIIKKPVSFTTAQYYKKVKVCIAKAWKENRIPIIIGGSGFYLKSLFFPQVEISNKNSKNIKKIDYNNIKQEDLWEILNKIDCIRAQQINKNDIYRIKRAIDLWNISGIKPSSLSPEYKPIAQNYLGIFLNRDIKDLYSRINKRTKIMLQSGWLDEVRDLKESWKLFLKEKRLIGYAEIIDFIEKIEKEDNIQKIELSKLKNNLLPANPSTSSGCAGSERDLRDLVEEISKQTRNYAKRQATFFRSFLSKLCKQKQASLVQENLINELIEINLTELKTSAKINTCIKKISTKIINMIVI